MSHDKQDRLTQLGSVVFTCRDDEAAADSGTVHEIPADSQRDLVASTDQEPPRSQPICKTLGMHITVRSKKSILASDT